MSRDNFSAKTKIALAQRSGYLCSRPDCQRITIGPSDESTDKAVNAGIAAHITAAAPGGPRFDGSMSDEERCSINNGIWLCAYCANIVDKVFAFLGLMPRL